MVQNTLIFIYCCLSSLGTLITLRSANASQRELRDMGFTFGSGAGKQSVETQMHRIHIVINDVKPGLHYIKVSVITVEILHR
jgi:hypothetical protein